MSAPTASPTPPSPCREQSSSEGRLSEFLTIDEVAALTKLAKSTIYHYTSQDRIPYYKFGNRLLFRREEVLACILATRQGAGS